MLVLEIRRMPSGKKFIFLGTGEKSMSLRNGEAIIYTCADNRENIMEAYQYLAEKLEEDIFFGKVSAEDIINLQAVAKNIVGPKPAKK